jgi:N,N'-diacetyllegionaminate synthase
MSAHESVFVIAEIGSNHNGDRDLAHLMIDHAAESGASAAKFQTFSADGLYSPLAPRLTEMANFNGVPADVTPHQLAATLQIDRSWHGELADHCKDVGIEFMSTPFDLEAVAELDPLVQRHKVASFDLTNKELVQEIARCGKPIVLSTGHAYLGEVEESLGWIRDVDTGVHVTLLQCTSQYPTDPHDVHLRAMETMHRAFGCDVGLSDHTLGIAVSLGAVALGATTLERHVTEDVDSPGPDHRFALEPDVLRALVDGCAAVVAALGDATKKPADSEMENRLLARRSVHASTDLRSGHVLRREDLSVVRPALGIAPRDIDAVIGRTLKVDLVAGSPIEWSHV